MTPSFTIYDERNGHKTASVRLCNFAEQPSVIVQFSHLDNLGFYEFVASMFRSLHLLLAENSKRMFVIVAGGHCFEVIKARIPLISVLMVNLPSIWNRAAKSLPDFYMNHVHFSLVVFGQGDARVLARWRNFSNSVLGFISPQSDSFDASKVADFVKSFISDNWFPLFHVEHYTKAKYILQGQL